MIAPVQLRVLRQMMDTNVMTLTHGGAFYRGTPRTKKVRARTIWVLVKKGLAEDISDPAWRWRGSEYQITDLGREVVDDNSSTTESVTGDDGRQCVDQ